MGTIQHKAVLVTADEDRDLPKVYKKAKKLFPEESVSSIGGLGVNGYKSFFIAPCGSKLGWIQDQEHTKAIQEFITYLNTFKHEDGSTSVKYVYVTYGELSLTVDSDSDNFIYKEEG